MYYFNRVEKQLNIKSPDDWYHITAKDLHKQGGAGLLRGRGVSNKKREGEREIERQIDRGRECVWVMYCYAERLIEI